MIKVKIIDKIKFPDLIFIDELKEIADTIFIPILQENINNEVDIQERPYPPLAVSTLKAKAKKGQSLKVLTATGRLRSSFTSYQRGKNEVIITVIGDRYQIGDYLQNQGIKSKKFGKRFFNFFGVSTRMEKAALKLMERKIAEALR